MHQSHYLLIISLAIYGTFIACKTTDVVPYYNLTAKPKKKAPKQNKTKQKTKKKKPKPTTLIRHTSTSARLNKNMSNRNIRL